MDWAQAVKRAVITVPYIAIDPGRRGTRFTCPAAPLPQPLMLITFTALLFTYNL